MDNKEMWRETIEQLKHLNRTLEKLLKMAHQGEGDDSDQDSRSGKAVVLSRAGHSGQRGIKPDSKWDRFLRRWKSRVELAGIVFGIAYAIITYLQWRDANNNFRAGQRAWVLVAETRILPVGGPEVADIPITAGVPNTIAFKFVNSGLSPALRFRAQTESKFGGSGCNYLSIPLQSGDEIDVAPQQKPGDQILQFTPDKACVSALESGQASLILQGVATYSDIFNNVHHTGYCFQYEGTRTRQFTSCPGGFVD
ncbi:hypothetical protein [Granulicella aggregans]|uniref:hypothetical protein n=1 Tax=Granulicella aggregans TaxID=474949 RepID=UPI0021E05578|nr:hypothetical protein [Granulicella aggregans]